MTQTLHFEFVSPEKQILSRDVQGVIVPGTEGDFSVFVRHAPMVSCLRTAFVEILDKEAREKILVRGGFAEINRQGLTILADEAIALSDLNREQLQSDLKEAEEDVTDAKDEERRSEATRRYHRLQEIIRALDQIT